MIRLGLLTIFMVVIAIVSTKNWFRALCLAVPLLAFLERPDMPRTMLGVEGLNPYNIVLACVLLGWFIQRRAEKLSWRVDHATNRLFLAYLLVIVIATVRALFDSDGINENLDVFKDGLINAIKWLIPGLLICHGANTPARRRNATITVLITGLFLSLQVILKMAPALVEADDLATRALRVLDRDLGYHRVDLAAITASASWGFYAFRAAFSSRFYSIACWVGFITCSIALALTGGRAGLLAWLVCGAAFAMIRKRSLIFLLPVVIVLIFSFVPGLKDRIFEGFDEGSYETAALERGLDTIDAEGRDQFAITSGRIVVWPVVMDKAKESPIFGYGRYAMQREGVSRDLAIDYGVAFDHPHNAYLEIMLDTGLLGLAICLAFHLRVGLGSLRLVRSQHESNINNLVAAVALSYLIVQAVAAVGSQSFYPQQSGTLLWIMIGLTMSMTGMSVNLTKTARSSSHEHTTRTPIR